MAECHLVWNKAIAEVIKMKSHCNRVGLWTAAGGMWGESTRGFFKRWEYQTNWPASWETCVQFRKQQLELDMEKQTGPKFEKEYIKALYCHPAYLTSMKSTSWETLGWNKHKLESRLPGEISITSDM